MIFTGAPLFALNNRDGDLLAIGFMDSRLPTRLRAVNRPIASLRE
jgi:hypothetical protein